MLSRQDIPSQLTQKILSQVRTRFYQKQPDEQFFRDRKMLIHAVSWPAIWLKQRALHISHQRYYHIICQRLDDIKKHADGQTLQYAYFPRYLLKCLQNHFLFQGDRIYDELKHIRFTLEIILEKIPQQKTQEIKNQQNLIDILAQAHRLTKPTKSTKNSDNKKQTYFDF